MSQSKKKFDVYRTNPPGLDAIKSPSEYGLNDFTEESIAYGDEQTLCFWERKTSPDKPTIIMYHGMNGHWGGIMTKEGLNSLRINWLKSLPKDANVIAVSMPGFGKSTGEAKRENFDKANDALIEKLRRDGVDFRTISARGESLGANHALNFARKAYKLGSPISQVDAIAPFTTASEAFKHHPVKPIAKQAGKITRQPEHSHSNIDEIEALKGSGTKILIIAPQDEIAISPPKLQNRLAMVADNVRLCTSIVFVKGKHAGWSPEEAQKNSAIMSEKPLTLKQLREELARNKCNEIAK